MGLRSQGQRVGSQHSLPPSPAFLSLEHMHTTDRRTDTRVDTHATARTDPQAAIFLQFPSRVSARDQAQHHPAETQAWSLPRSVQVRAQGQGQCEGTCVSTCTCVCVCGTSLCLCFPLPPWSPQHEWLWALTTPAACVLLTIGLDFSQLFGDRAAHPLVTIRKLLMYLQWGAGLDVSTPGFSERERPAGNKANLGPA